MENERPFPPTGVPHDPASDPGATGPGATGPDGSRPAPARHLQQSPSQLLGGRRAARLRAIAASAGLPHERATADATVMAAWLTTAQRARYAPLLRAGDDLDEFVVRLADERRVMLEEGTDTVADELDAAAAAERAARPTVLRTLEILLLLVVVAALVVFARSDNALEDLRALGTEGGLGHVLEQARDDALLTGTTSLAVGLVALIAAAVVGAIATRRRDRAMLDWAVSRPGQLGRGIPMRRALQTTSIGVALVMVAGPVILTAFAIIGLFTGAAILLILLISRDEPSFMTAGWVLLGSSAAALLLAAVLSNLRMRRLEQMVRRSMASEWLGRYGSKHPEG
ncbi:hypothetical protein ACXET9_01060 [Brachybacterium sp. DNPG3]